MSTIVEGALFNSPEYLDPLARCASAEQGWQRQPSWHAPVYLKSHSWGEFVFDHPFANAYHAQGLSYYPKLVCAIPYTPVPGPRLGPEAPTQSQLLQDFAQTSGASSVHLLFVAEAERRALGDSDFLPRIDLRFVWRDRGYGDFSGFVARMKRKQRKNILAERRRVTASGLTLQWLSATDLCERDWLRIYELYASTYQMRGQMPYLDLACLRDWGAQFGPQFQFCVARSAQGIEAMAYFFRDQHSLYGRHWGAARDYHALHFELCYYQAIEYCLAEGLQHFDAGVQGEHRLRRGFEPEISTSLHWFARPEFQAAVARYLERERSLLLEHFEAARQATAFALNEPDSIPC